jgi:lysozyme
MSLSPEVRTIIDGTTAQLEQDEGFRAKPYIDTVGVPTFGHGLTYIKQSESLRIVSDRLYELYGRLEINQPWFGRLNAKRKSVILNMAYNLGYAGVVGDKANGIRGFKDMIAAIERGDFQAAGAEMLNSKWARQVGERAGRLAVQMVEG